MMNKQEFLRRLEEGLATVAPEERVAALQYYSEYFDDAGPENEAEVMSQIGDPEQLAADIRAESGAPEPPNLNFPGMGAAPAAPDLVSSPPVPVDEDAFRQGQQAAQNMLRRTSFGPGSGSGFNPPPQNAQQPGYQPPYGQQTPPPYAPPQGSGLGGALKVLLIIGLIMFSPAILGVLISVVMVMVMLALVPWIVCVAFGAVGVGGFFLAIPMLTVSLGNALVIMGLCMVLIGIAGLAGWGGIKAFSKGVRGCFQLIRTFFNWVGRLGRKEQYYG